MWSLKQTLDISNVSENITPLPCDTDIIKNKNSIRSNIALKFPRNGFLSLGQRVLQSIQHSNHKQHQVSGYSLEENFKYLCFALFITLLLLESCGQQEFNFVSLCSTVSCNLQPLAQVSRMKPNHIQFFFDWSTQHLVWAAKPHNSLVGCKCPSGKVPNQPLLPLLHCDWMGLGDCLFVVFPFKTDCYPHLEVWSLKPATSLMY